MASTYELRRLRQRYYDLKGNLSYALGYLSKVPNELDDAKNYLASSFTIDETSIDGRSLQNYSEAISSAISDLRSHISKIEYAIRVLDDRIEDLERMEELM